MMHVWEHGGRVTLGSNYAVYWSLVIGSGVKWVNILFHSDLKEAGLPGSCGQRRQTPIVCANTRFSCRVAVGMKLSRDANCSPISENIWWLTIAGAVKRVLVWERWNTWVSKTDRDVIVAHQRSTYCNEICTLTLWRWICVSRHGVTTDASLPQGANADLKWCTLTLFGLGRRKYFLFLL